VPPSMTNFSMGGRLPATSAGPEGWARVTAMPSGISLDDARSLLADWVSSPSLRRHCLAVSAAMRAYASRTGDDPGLWAVTGLLHDADYERFPDMDDTQHGHPRTIMAELERRNAPPEMVRAIASHADYLGVAPQSPMERTLVAVDELCGFLVACAQVRPEGIHGLTPKSVKKKLRQPSFAAAVSREDVRGGAELLVVDFDEHVAFVIAALEARADELELHGRGAAPSEAPV
jgi:putative nucleotidyltransferase with HDIG domain